MFWHMQTNDDTPRRASLFRNGRNQAVRIPRDLELPGDEVLIRRDGGRLVIEPAPPASLVAYLAGLAPLDEAPFEPADPPPEPVDL